MTQDKQANWDDLIKLLTVDQLSLLRDEVIDLEKALKNIPAAFDASFQTKINTVLDITAKLEEHAIKQKYEIVGLVKSEIKDCIGDEIRKNKAKANSSLRFIFAVLFSGLISASITISFIMLYMMN